MAVTKFDPDLYFETLADSKKVIYTKKLKEFGIPQCPFTFEEYSSDPKTCQPVGYGDIFSYFVDNTSFHTRQAK